jgi:hypothetical protein
MLHYTTFCWQFFILFFILFWLAADCAVSGICGAFRGLLMHCWLCWYVWRIWGAFQAILGGVDAWCWLAAPRPPASLATAAPSLAVLASLIRVRLLASIAWLRLRRASPARFARPPATPPAVLCFCGCCLLALLA